ncbi:MAG: DUF393 domain-containing protein [Pseudomonadota bacterium]
MTEKLTVYFDGSCPLCRREIDFYRRQRGADGVRWLDLTAADTDTGGDLSCADAMRRFHVRRADGTLASGARGFAALWRELPGFSWLGRFVALPGIAQLAEAAYRLFLIGRPAIQRTFARLERKAGV